MKDKVFEIKIRRKIYNLILKTPGIHKLKIQRLVDVPYSTLDYHLRELVKRDLVTFDTVGGYVRFYVSGRVSIRDKQVLSVLRQKTTGKIIIFLIENPHSSHGKIQGFLHIAPSTTSFHLKKLLDLNIISFKQVSKERHFYIKDTEYIIDLLVTFRRGFLDKAVDKFISTWMDDNRKRLKKMRKKD